MNPGSSVALPRSTVRAPLGMVTELAGPTATIRSSVTTTTPFWIGAAPVPSMTRAALRTTVPEPLIGFVGACVSATVGRHNASVSDIRRRVRIGIGGLEILGEAADTGRPVKRPAYLTSPSESGA